MLIAGIATPKIATGTVRGSESNRQNIVDAVHRMLENFPPS